MAGSLFIPQRMKRIYFCRTTGGEVARTEIGAYNPKPPFCTD